MNHLMKKELTEAKRIQYEEEAFQAQCEENKRKYAGKRWICPVCFWGSNDYRSRSQHMQRMKHG